MPIGKPFKRSPTGPYWVRGTVRGQSVFESTRTDDYERAQAYAAKREAELWDRSVWGARSVVTFAHAAESYLRKQRRRDGTLALVRRLILHFGQTQLHTIDQEALDRAYAKLLRPDAAPATKLRNVLVPLRAIMEHAARRKWCDRPAFETPGETTNRRVVFLRPEEARRLVASAAEHLRPLIVFLLCTGCRMSEALELDWSRVDLRGARAVVWQKQQNERHVDLPPAAIAALAGLRLREGRVFRPPGEEAYRDTDRTSGGQIRSGWRGACKRAGLGTWSEHPTRRDAGGNPLRIFEPRLTPHGLRHTWATWHYAVHKDLLLLQRDGGWSNQSQVQVYAHLLPAAYREEVLAFWQGAPMIEVRRA